MATDPMTYEVTRSIVEDGSVAMSYNVQRMEAHRGIDGRYSAPYGLGHALYNIPFYVAGRAIEGWTGLDARKLEIVRKAVVVLGSAVAASLVVWLAFLFARAIGGSARAAAKTAVALGLATLLWPYAKFGFNAPLATLCLLAGAYGGWRATSGGRTGALLGAGAGIGSAVLVRHELALGAIPIAALVWMASGNCRREVFRRWSIFASPIGVAVVVTLLYNYARFGNPFDTGYLRDETARPGLPWSLGEGVLGLLVSPGRSVFLYSPVTLAGVAALAGLWRREKRLAVLCGGEAVVLLVFYASLKYWDADRSYGPRYLVPTLPFLVLPLVFWFDRDRRDGGSGDGGSGDGRSKDRPLRREEGALRRRGEDAVLRLGREGGAVRLGGKDGAFRMKHWATAWRSRQRSGRPSGDSQQRSGRPSGRPVLRALSLPVPSLRAPVRSALVALSVLVQIPGVLVDFSKVGYTPDVGCHSLEERRWNWGVAGLTLNTRAALSAIPANWRYLTGAATPPAIRPGALRSRDFSEQFAFSLDFWWLHLFYLGAVSAPVAAGLGLACLAVAGGCAWGLWRSLADEHGAASPSTDPTDSGAAWSS